MFKDVLFSLHYTLYISYKNCPAVAIEPFLNIFCDDKTNDEQLSYAFRRKTGKYKSPL